MREEGEGRKDQDKPRALCRTALGIELSADSGFSGNAGHNEMSLTEKLGK